MQVPPAAMACSKGLEGRPELLHVLSMFRLLWPPIWINRHSKCAHHRLQTALRAESVQLVGIRPTSVREEHFCILPVPAMGIGEICWVRHRRARP